MAGSYRRLSDVCDEWLTPIVSVAIVFGILHSIPNWLAVATGLLGPLKCFLAGLFAGLAIGAVILIGLLFLVTEVYRKKDSHSSVKPGSIPNPHPSSYHPFPPLNFEDGKPVPPALIGLKGRFSGTVWTVPVSEWDRTEALKDVDIHTKEITKWMADLERGILTLTPDAPKKQPVVLHVEGCTVKVVQECLGSKTLWWKKGPLEISHHERELLDGDNSFFMFCEHGGAKEQWFISLSRLDREGESVQLLQDMYSRYSALCHQKQCAAFPFIGSSQTMLPTSPKDPKNPNQRRGWMRPWRWVNGRGQHKLGGVEGQVLRGQASFDSTEEGNPIAEMERMWSKEGWHFKGDDSEEKDGNGKKGLKAEASSSPGGSILSNDTAKDSAAVEGTVDGASPKSRVSTDSPSPAGGGEQKQQYMGFDPRLLDEFPLDNVEETLDAQKSPKEAGENLSSSPIGGQQPPAANSSRPSEEEWTSPRPSDQGGKEKAGISESDSMDGIHGLNMFLARWAFDLARNPLFEQKFKEKLQKKLNGLRRPSFVNPLTLVSIEVGANFPVIHNVRSLPSPTKVIWPQILLDLSYSGGLELIIETTVDINETWAWSALDKAINIVGGQNQTMENEGDCNEMSSEFVGELSTSPEQSLNMEGGSSAAPGTSRAARKLRGILPLRQAFAGKAKKLAEKMAEQISKIPLRLNLKISKVEGQLLVWVAPPPSDRLWLSFVGMPKLELEAKPILANRVMKYSAQLGRVSSWLEKKLQTSFFRSLVFPNCTDMRFPLLLGLTSDWGLRNPGKVLMTELASVAASEEESEEESAVVENPSNAATSYVAERCGDKIGIESSDSHHGIPDAVWRSGGNKSKRTGPERWLSNHARGGGGGAKYRSRSHGQDGLKSIEEHPSEIRLRSVRSRSVGQQLFDLDGEKEAYGALSFSDGGGGHAGEENDFQLPSPSSSSPGDLAFDSMDQASFASVDSSWLQGSEQEHSTRGGNGESVESVDHVLQADSCDRPPVASSNGGNEAFSFGEGAGDDVSSKKNRIKAAKAKAGQQTSKMKEALGTGVAHFRKAATGGRFLIGTRKCDEV
ncbi:hypothetical protein BSKO_07057 [Bryopsis sp. KO-2023]|nr:hypothetical protein BSKO_07057 [Bryopsis sp. KO-2023]